MLTIQQDDDTSFNVPVAGDCYETYKLEYPPHSLATTKKELKRLFRDMSTIRYGSPSALYIIADLTYPTYTWKHRRINCTSNAKFEGSVTFRLAR